MATTALKVKTTIRRQRRITLSIELPNDLLTAVEIECMLCDELLDATVEAALRLWLRERRLVDVYPR